MNRPIKICAAVLCGALLITGCTPEAETVPTTVLSESSETSLIAETSETTETELPTTTVPSETEPEYQDVTPPVILSANSSVSLNVGDIFDANNYISYIDDYDRNPVLTMETPVDTTVAGSYETAMIVTDNAGNYVRKPLSVRVRGAGDDAANTPTPTPVGFVPTNTPVPQPSTIQWNDFVSRYSGDNVELGIDVSKWQGDVDYDRVKNAGVKFVMIRAGVYYQGEFNFDSKFEQNFRNAKAAGLKVGLYFFTPVTSEEVLRENVDRICEALNGEELDLPIAYDMETWTRFQQYHISLNDLNNLFYAFCEEAESYGYTGMLYNSKNKLESVFDAGGRPVWLAHYTSQTSYEGDYVMWQVNCIGRVPGINGDVDLNILYLDRFNGN